MGLWKQKSHQNQHVYRTVSLWKWYYPKNRKQNNLPKPKWTKEIDLNIKNDNRVYITEVSGVQD